MPRRRRAGEVVCRCGAYKFPHRWMGGDCNGGAFVSSLWERTCGGGECRGCPLIDEGGDGERICQVVAGIEEIMQCPELADAVRFEGVKLYGVNRPPEKKMGWRR